MFATLFLANCTNFPKYPNDKPCTFIINEPANFDCYTKHGGSQKIKLFMNVTTRFYYGRDRKVTYFDDKSIAIDPLSNPFPVSIIVNVPDKGDYLTEVYLQGEECSECANGASDASETPYGSCPKTQPTNTNPPTSIAAKPRWTGGKRYDSYVSPATFDGSGITRVHNVPNSCGCYYKLVNTLNNTFMKYYNRIIIAFSILFLFNSCAKDGSINTKTNEIPDFGISFLKTDSLGIPNNYVVLISSYTVNALDSTRKNSYQTNVFAKFGNSRGERINRGNLKVNNQIIQSGSDNSYQFQYKDNFYNEGKLLFGKKIPIEVQGNSQFASTNSIMSVPQELLPPTIYNFPSSTIDKNSNLHLNWQPDPENEFHKVQIQITYYQGISQYNASGMPNDIESLVYTVDDIGFFTIPQIDLARFPLGCYVELSIARASTNNTGDIAYLSVVYAHSIPLLIVGNLSPLVVDFSFSTNNSNPCSFTAIANVSGGKPSYGYNWSTFTEANPTPIEIGTSNPIFGNGYCSASINNGNTNIVQPTNGQTTYLKLQVIDANGNTATVTKKLIFKTKQQPSPDDIK